MRGSEAPLGTKRDDIAKYLNYSEASLSEIIAHAKDIGVEHLLISAEEFDFIEPHRCIDLAQVLSGHDVTMLLTVTRPSHRWYSIWQELVKHGLAERPLDAAPHILGQCALLPARLEELTTSLPGARKVVRIVRTDPVDIDLARTVGRLLGVELPATDTPPPPANVSIGSSTELLRSLNEQNVTHGVMTPDSITAFVEYREAHPAVPGSLPHAERYGTPSELAAAAAAELAFLKAASREGEIELVDPDGELARWTDMAPPTWMTEALQSEWPAPECPAKTDADRAWAARVELATWVHLKNKQISETEAVCGELREELSKRVAGEERIAAELSEAHTRNRDLQNQTASLNAAIRSMQESRSWRVFGPFRRLRQRRAKFR
jgi:hypothetical protein